MGKRAENKIDFRLYLDRDLKDEFKYYTSKENSKMSIEITKFIESYVRRAKRREKLNKHFK